MTRILFLIAIGLVAQACGVRGDPTPPATPAEIGRGQPTYKRATEEFAFPDVPPIYQEKKKTSEDQ